jgi:hypothetical protein
MSAGDIYKYAKCLISSENVILEILASPTNEKSRTPKRIQNRELQMNAGEQEGLSKGWG